jgi:Ran GTPase-activating protein (RanGAP) involved in mRNA processing and transport
MSMASNVAGPTQMKIEQYKKIFGTQEIVVLTGKNLTDEDALAIGELLKTNNTLKVLDLGHNNITDVQSIGEALKTNNTLVGLELYNNNITDVQSIGEALKTNDTLTTLRLSRNNITDGGIQSIIDGLKTNKTLRTLVLGGNQLSDNMKSQLEAIQQYKIDGAEFNQVKSMWISHYSNKIKLRF